MRRSIFSSPPRSRARRHTLLFVAAAAALLLLVYLASSVLAGFLKQTPGGPYRVAVDAGHGGGDNGASGLAGSQEWALTQATAQALWELLETDPDFIPLMVRADWDASATAGERARTARRQHADLLLSIHMNSDGGAGTASGFECFPAPPQSPQNAGSMRFADLLAAEMGAAGAALRGQGGVRYAYYTPEGQRLIRERGDLNEQNLESFAVVELPGCPAVLAEQCFITNQGDFDAFAGPEGQRAAAGCYYRAIRQFFGLPAQPPAPGSAA